MGAEWPSNNWVKGSTAASHRALKRRCSCSSLVSLASLIHIFSDVFLLEFSHALNFIQVYNEACVVRVMLPDAFTTKHCQMIAAVEVLDSLRMLCAQLLLNSFLVNFAAPRAGIFEIEIRLREDRILLHYFIEDVDIQRQSLCAL